MESGREGGKRIQLFGRSSQAQGQPFIVKKPNRKLRLKEIDVEESEFENPMKSEKTLFAGLPVRKVQLEEFNLLLQQQRQRQRHRKEGKLVDVRLIHESVGRDLKCNCCQHHVPRSLKHSISCPKYLPHMMREGPKDIPEGELVEWIAQKERVRKYQKAAEDISQAKTRLQQRKEEGKLVDVRLIHESIGRDLKCNSCQHHVPKSLKHSILCRKYEGPPGTRLYRCFTSCPNCFVEWELWPNNRYADSFDVLSGATYQEIIPNSGQM